MTRITFAIILILTCVFLSCSANKADPVTPSDAALETEPLIINETQNTNHNLLGTWVASFNIETLKASVEPNREMSRHYSILSFIEPPTITVNYWDPATETANVSVTIKNTTYVSAFDVRLIIFTDEAGHKLKNADNWTGLWDIPDGLPINPFKAYAKSITRRNFQAQASHTEDLQIFCPDENFEIQFAIDASHPGNCEEPYSISDFEMDTLFDEVGSSAELRITVDDWNGDVDSVWLYCPQIYGGLPLHFGPVNPTPPHVEWITTLVNNTGASVGEYFGYIEAKSTNSGDVALYQQVTINVYSLLNSGWCLDWGGIGSGYTYPYARGKKLIFDGFENIFAVSIFAGTIDFNPGSGVDERSTPTYYDSHQGGNVFSTNSAYSMFSTAGVYKGVEIWNTSGCGAHYIKALDMDSSSNMYIAGYIEGTAWPPEYVQGDVFRKYRRNGSLLFNKRFNTIGEARCYSMSLCIDDQDVVYLGGYTNGLVDFDPSDDTYWHNADNWDAYVCKFDSDGNYIETLFWEMDTRDDRIVICNLMFDNDNCIYAAGRFYGTVDLNPGPGVSEHSTSQHKAFICKFTTDGEFLWAKSWGNNIGYACVNDIAMDPNGNIYTTGYFSGTADLDPGPGEDIHVAFEEGIFLSKLDSNGDLLFVRSWDGSDDDIANSVVCDSTGNSIVTGYFKEEVDFDPGPGETIVESAGVRDIFISKFDPEGDLLWVRTWGNYMWDEGYDLCLDESDNIYATGRFHHNIDFDPGTSEDWHAPEGSNTNAFLIKLLPSGYWY
jgi:hypothetical protein